MARPIDSEAERPSFAPHVSLARIGRIPRPHPETWGPPPLHPFLFQEQQDKLLADVEALTRDSVPSDMPDDLAREIVNTAGSRFVGRMMANYDNLVSAAQLDAPMTDRQRRLADFGLAGIANPAELTYVSDLIKARGVALGTVTHPFGEHVEDLDEMREATDETISLFRGQKLDRTPAFAVKGVYREKVDRPGQSYGDLTGVDKGALHALKRYFGFGSGRAVEHIEGAPLGILMTRKKNVGRIAQTIWFRERSSFIVRLDEASGIDDETKRALLAMIESDDAMDTPIDPSSDLQQAIFDMVEHDEFDQAVPLATTMYKYDEATPKPARPFHEPNTVDPRKSSPILTYALTQSQLRLSGVPLEFEASRNLPLSALIHSTTEDVD